MNLHFQTVTAQLKDYLYRLMQHPAFDDFYLAGGTALSLWGLQKYPYSLSRNEILEKIYHVWDLDDQTDVVSLKDGVWDFVADDLCEEAKNYLSASRTVFKFFNACFTGLTCFFCNFADY